MLSRCHYHIVEPHKQAPVSNNGSLVLHLPPLALWNGRYTNCLLSLLLYIRQEGPMSDWTGPIITRKVISQPGRSNLRQEGPIADRSGPISIRKVLLQTGKVYTRQEWSYTQQEGPIADRKVLYQTRLSLSQPERLYPSQDGAISDQKVLSQPV